MIIGNDLVYRKDLSHHPRFFQRITTKTERQGHPDTILRAQCLWAIKESAFKAFRQTNSQSPKGARHYEVSPDMGQVSLGSEQLSVTLEIHDAYIFAVAYPAGSQTYSLIHNCREHQQSQSARLCALELAIKYLGPQGHVQVEKQGKVPKLRTEQAQYPLSLTHDGPYAAASTLATPY